MISATVYNINDICGENIYLTENSRYKFTDNVEIIYHAAFFPKRINFNTYFTRFSLKQSHISQKELPVVLSHTIGYVLVEKSQLISTHISSTIDCYSPRHSLKAQ